MLPRASTSSTSSTASTSSEPIVAPFSGLGALFFVLVVVGALTGSPLSSVVRPGPNLPAPTGKARPRP
ncbi:hypothetical protein L3i22_033490 [Actinoplanes sp. L3-i22]|nr:hypothetical protein L3i22_033490 [Actinoplanes sp. L3-i22]